MCIVWMLYSVGVSFFAPAVACYRFAFGVPLYPDVDTAYASILAKRVVLFSYKYAHDSEST